MHKHTYQGQSLVHGHKDGEQEHGYFGHPEDKGSPAYGQGTYEYLDGNQAHDPDKSSTLLADALAASAQAKADGFHRDGTIRRHYVLALADVDDAARAYLDSREGGPTSFDPATAQLRLDQVVHRLAQYPRVTKDGQLASMLSSLSDELQAAGWLRPVYAVTHARIEDMAGREVTAEEFARIAMAIEFDEAAGAAVRAAVKRVIDLPGEDDGS